jgi:hypothetical protein
MFAQVADSNILGHHIAYTNISARLVVKSDLEHCEACNIMIENFARAIIELTKVEATTNEATSPKVLPEMSLIRPFSYANIIMPVTFGEQTRKGWVHRGADMVNNNTLTKTEDEIALELVQEKYSDTRPVLIFSVGQLDDNANCAMYVGSCDVRAIKSRFNTFVITHRAAEE